MAVFCSISVCLVSRSSVQNVKSDDVTRYVNDEPLVNMGGIINMESDAMCPEDIQTPWSFYRWGDGEVNDWEEDPFLKVTCGGEIPKTTTSTTTLTEKTTSSTTERPGPQPEPCTWGSGCAGCEVS